MTSTQTIMTSLLIPNEKIGGPCKLKLAVLGDKQVGKTSLLSRYIRGIYNPTYVHTKGGDISHKDVDVNGVHVHLTLIDSAGHKYVRSLIKSLYRNVHGIMVVYDVTRVHTFEALDEWLKQIKLVNVDNPFIMLVGNKNDLVAYNSIPQKRAQHYADQKDLPWMEVSAKSGYNVMEAFSDLIAGTFKDKMPTGYTMTSIHVENTDGKDVLKKDSPRCSC